MSSQLTARLVRQSAGMLKSGAIELVSENGETVEPPSAAWMLAGMLEPNEEFTGTFSAAKQTAGFSAQFTAPEVSVMKPPPCAAVAARLVALAAVSERWKVMVLSRKPVLLNEFARNTSGRPPEKRPTPPLTLTLSIGRQSKAKRGISTSRPS